MAGSFQKNAEDAIGLTDTEAKWINEHPDAPGVQTFLECLLIQSNRPDHGGMALLGVALRDLRIEISRPLALN